MKSIYTRIIKFKAWHRQEKKLFTVTKIRFHLDGKFEVQLEGIPDEWFSDHDIELLQYTNLPDMHDQEIYEGFVLRDPKTDCYYEVLYRADRFMVERRLLPEDDGKRGYELADLYDINEKTEIVGNIFAHRDLLQKVGYSHLTTDDLTNLIEEEDTSNHN